MANIKDRIRSIIRENFIKEMGIDKFIHLAI